MTRLNSSILFLVLATVADGFVALAPPLRRTKPLAMNFFKDIMGKAFENDVSLDKDQTKGQYDGPGDEDPAEGMARFGELTETQQRWRQSQGQAGSANTAAALLTDSQWKLDLFLTGIPDRDPSNDLFASKVNISSRDRKVGLMIPEEPTVSGITITLLEDGICQVVKDDELSEFLNAQELEGAWKVSDDGAQIRISLNVMGYQRTVQTKGSIQKIYWSQEDDTPVATSTAYNIPAGPMFGDAAVQSGARVGTLQWNDGILQVEKAAGLLGAGSKMVPCGRFTATRMMD